MANKKEIRTVTRKCVLNLSDLHCGSIYGLMPPNFITSAGVHVMQNPGQKHLWRCWEDLAKRVADAPIAAVVVDGDAVDGEERRCQGAELVLPLPEDQAECAAVCLRYLLGELKSKPPVFVIRGTPYHDAEAGGEAERVAAKIGARPYVGYGQGRLCKRAMDLEIDGVVGNFSHGISCSGGLYRTTAPDREAVWSALAGKDGKLPKADYLVRAHAHYFVHVEHQTKHAIVNPSWQLQTDYMGKNSVYRMLPDVGSTVIWIDGEKKAQREDPVQVQKILYDLPPIGTHQL